MKGKPTSMDIGYFLKIVKLQESNKLTFKEACNILHMDYRKYWTYKHRYGGIDLGGVIDDKI